MLIASAFLLIIFYFFRCYFYSRAIGRTIQKSMLEVFKHFDDTAFMLPKYEFPNECKKDKSYRLKSNFCLWMCYLSFLATLVFSYIKYHK